MMESVRPSLLPKLITAKEYLSTKDDSLKIYQDLLIEIDSLINELPHIKPKLKLVSSDISLSKQVKRITAQDLTLKQQYQLQLVSLDTENRHIINGCEFILLVWEQQQKISAQEQQLIQQALDRGIVLGMVVIGDRYISIDSWLEQQNHQFPWARISTSNNFLVLKNTDSIEQYQNALVQLLPAALVKLETKLAENLIKTIDRSIKDSNQKTQQKIKTQQKLVGQENGVELFRQQVNQLICNINKIQQQTIQEIKREINHKKAVLINPFAQDNFIWQTQQIIIDSEIEIVKEGKKNYLIPVIKTDNDVKKIYLYLADLYQTEFQNHLTQEWNKCSQTYANGGLNQLRQKILQELEPIAHLCDININPETTYIPGFQLSTLAYLPTLSAGSKLIFDYHYSDSKWFRLSIAACIGAIIYLATKLLFGEGRFFGFIIIIYQVINLFAGQDAKTVKLKQHIKELKRILDNKYQILIRLCVDKNTRDLIAGVDNEHRYYQQQLDAIAKTVNQKLSAVKKTIESDRQAIDRLKQDRQHLISLLNNT